jgi:hypothetical protein
MPKHPAQRRMVMQKFKALGFAILIATSVPTTGVCGSPARKIVIKKEVVLMRGKAVALHSIVKTPDGGLVILGDYGHGWATRVTAEGAVIWDYQDDGHSVPDSHSPDQNSFIGALMLSDNSTLLCGRKQGPKAGDDTTGYLVHLDAAGNVLSRSSFYANEDKAYSMSSINRCFPWGDGFALIGGASNRNGGTGWLIKLNAQGTKEWEKVGPDVGGGDGIETANHDLMLVSPGSTLNTVILRRLNNKGEMMAHRTIEQNLFFFIRSMVPSSNAYAGIYRLSSSLSLSTNVAAFDSDLRDLAPERPLKTISFDHGRVFMFPDRSLAIFGYVDLSDHSSTAAAAYVDSDFKERSSFHFKPERGSIWVEDAVALNSEGDFAVVRTAVSPDIKQVGILLTWVSIK